MMTALLVAALAFVVIVLAAFMHATRGADELRERLLVRHIQRDRDAREITADELPEALARARAEMLFSIDDARAFARNLKSAYDTVESFVAVADSQERAQESMGHA